MADVPALPQTPEEWFSHAQTVYQDFLDVLVHYGIEPDPALRLVAGDQPNPYYEHATLTIAVGMPDATRLQGRLYWIYIARLLGLERVDDAIAAIFDQLPLLVCHELVHHLRHQYHAPTSNDFVEEQVANIVALAFLNQHPRYQATIPRLRAMVERGAARFATISPETVPYLAGYRLELGDVLVAQGSLDAERMAKLRQLTGELGEDLETLLAQSEVIASAALSQAEANREQAQQYFNQKYTANFFEYAFFFNEWLRTYLARNAIPPLGLVLETYLLTDDWERTRVQETELLLTAMLWHPQDDLATAAAEALVDEAGAAAEPLLLNALEQERPALQAVILGSLVRLGCAAPRMLALAEQLVGQAEIPLRAAAAVVLYKAGGARGARGRALLQELLLGEPQLREAALVAITPLRDPSFLPIISSCLGSLVSAVRVRAIQYLTRLPRRAIISRLAATALSDPQDEVRRAAIACLKSQATRATLSLLAQSLDDPASVIRRDAIEALRSHGRAALPTLASVQGRWRARAEVAVMRHAFDRRSGEPPIRRLIAELLLLIGQFTAQRQLLAGGTGPRQLLYIALAEERGKLANLALRLAGTLDNPTTMDVALRGLQSEHAEVRTTARELAGNAMPADLRSALQPLLVDDLDTLPLAAQARRARPNDLLIYVTPFIRQVAEVVVALDQATVGSPIPSEVEAMLTTIEKLMFLRAVPAFQAITLEDLRPIADQIIAQTFHQGEYIFSEGQEGDTMYIITIGQVGIEYNKRGGKELEVAKLGPGQYFGEMALFDGKPRSASALALEDTTLLTLGREPFLRLGTRQPRILIEVMRVLSSRLRQLVADMA